MEFLNESMSIGFVDASLEYFFAAKEHLSQQNKEDLLNKIESKVLNLEVNMAAMKITYETRVDQLLEQIKTLNKNSKKVQNSNRKLLRKLPDTNLKVDK